MGTNRFRFAEEEAGAGRLPPSIWVTRAVITSLIVGAAGVAHIFFGFKFF